MRPPRLLLALFLFRPWLTLSAPALALPLHLPLDAAQLQQWHRDGYLVLRNVIRPELLAAAQRQGERELLAAPRGGYSGLRFGFWRKHAAFRRIALESEAPLIAARLLALQKREGLRLVKDACLAYRPGDGACGWHVDDKVFLPVGDRKDLDGVVVWIPLSPVKAREGGGIAVARGSHRARWREPCRRAIAGRSAPRTCGMEQRSPRCQRKLDKRAVIYDMQPGDALFHRRYCFHRLEPMDELLRPSIAPKLHYSMRYLPGDAPFADVAKKLKMARREPAARELGLVTGDPISKAGRFMPQVWPTRIPREMREPAPKKSQRKPWHLF